MATFPTTTYELEQYIDDYMTAHIADRIPTITAQTIADAVEQYIAEYGAAMEDNGATGEVPLIPDNDLDSDNTTVPVAILSSGVPTSFAQSRIRAFAILAASLITAEDIATPVVVQTQATATIKPNVLNVWNAGNQFSAIQIAFDTPKAGVVNEYHFRIAIEDSDFTLTLPQGVTWADDEAPTYEDGTTLEVSVIENKALFAIW
jgi:hypothetical protein